jgi:hypothetical protein
MLVLAWQRKVGQSEKMGYVKVTRYMVSVFQLEIG